MLERPWSTEGPSRTPTPWICTGTSPSCGTSESDRLEPHSATRVCAVTSVASRKRLDTYSPWEGKRLRAWGRSSLICSCIGRGPESPRTRGREGGAFGCVCGKTSRVCVSSHVCPGTRCRAPGLARVGAVTADGLGHGHAPGTGWLSGDGTPPLQPCTCCSLLLSFALLTCEAVCSPGSGPVRLLSPVNCPPRPTTPSRLCLCATHRVPAVPGGAVCSDPQVESPFGGHGGFVL